MLRVERLEIARLAPLSFEVADGECLAVEGPSGAGKTLLLRALADLDPAPGLVFVDGLERNAVPAFQWRRTVRYCAAEPGWWTDTPRAGLPPDTPPGKLESLLRAIGLEPDLIDRPVAILSTGERQRLALVRALIDEPRVLLLDEPTGALDPQNTALVEELVRSQLLSGRSVVLVSHDAAQVHRLANARLTLVRDKPASSSEAVGSP